MIRLVDYFVVVGYDTDQETIGTNKQCGRIIQRFPEDDLPDSEFDNNIHCFCQPHGWKIYKKQEAPTFFVSVLTDMKAQRRYCACLTFLEPLQPSNATTASSTSSSSALTNSLNNASSNRMSSIINSNNLLDDSNADEFEDNECEITLEATNDKNISTPITSNPPSNMILPIGPCKHYIPKSLVIISKVDYYSLFKNVLTLIYAIYIDNRESIRLETVIANMLSVYVHPPGSSLITTFTLNADDRHYVQSCASTSVPNTGSCVYNLFKELGINHVLKLLCTILSDFKIIFFSRSYCKLTEASMALESLLFPLKYAGVFVPVLPCSGSFLEFPAAPTPYIIGVHSSYRRLIEDMHSDCLHDVVKVDLDGSSVSIPQNIEDIAQFPDYLHETTLNLLFSILKPDVLRADEAFSCGSSIGGSGCRARKSSTNMSNETLGTCQATLSSSSQSISSSNSFVDDPIWIDKQIRAIFVRLFAQLFAGYRYCLLVVRINPKPVICFHKANFLGHHGLTDNEFMNRLLDSMSFLKFIEERGPPYRNCDIFDDIYAQVQSQLVDETRNFDLIMFNLNKIAQQLFQYEYPHTNIDTYLAQLRSSGGTQSSSAMQTSSNTHRYHRSHSSNQNNVFLQPYRSISKIQNPTTDAFTRIHTQPFPIINSLDVNRLLITQACSALSSASLTFFNDTIANSTSPNSIPPQTTTSSAVIGSMSNISSGNNTNNPTTANTPRGGQYNNSPNQRLCVVQYGPPIETVDKLNKNTAHLHHQQLLVDVNSVWNVSCTRKLEVISNVVQHVFENNFKDAKKNLNSAFRALKDPRARLHLCNCLQKYVKKNHVILNNEQFDYVTKLLNEALQNDSALDEFGVAYSVLPLASAFYRKLNNGTVDQCIYTKLQSHAVWDNMQFWEMAFYTDVQKSIRPVYLTNEEFDAEQAKETTTSIDEQKQSVTTTQNTTQHNNESPSKNGAAAILSLNLNLHSRPAEKTALEICGEQMEKINSYTDEIKENFIRNEQGIIRSHVLHYITQMVNMKIPLDISKSIYSTTNNNLNNINHHHHQHHHHHHNSSSGNTKSYSNHHRHNSTSVTNGVYDDAESMQTDNDNSINGAGGAANGHGINGGGGITFADNLSIATEDSGYENGNAGYSYGIGEAGYSVWKFVSKFVERVCSEGYLSESQKQALHNNLTEVVSMQITTLETVYQESKRIPPRIKPKFDVLKPDYLLQNEQIIEPSPLRCYVVPDGREEVSGINGGPILVPAEGALYLTNYRIIYRGIPTDPLVSDAIITRAFPISALMKEKKISGQFHSENATTCLHDGMQMRSCTFQLIRVFFDEEVNTDKIEKFRQMMLKLRYPQTILDTFCFIDQFNGGTSAYFQTTLSIKNKEKGTDVIRNLAKNTKNTLRKAGLMPRNNPRKIPISARTPEISRKHMRSPKNEGTLSISSEQNTNTNGMTNGNGNQMSTPNNNNPDSDEESVPVDESIDSVNTNQMTTTLVNNDNKSLERWIENALAYKDYIRQGLIYAQGHKTLSRTNNDSFRVCTINQNYQFCRSYPAMFVVPKETSDECIKKNARCHRQNRVPIIVFRNPISKALLLRSSSFHGKGIIGMLMKGQTTSSTSSDTSASMEQDKYIMEIVKLTKPFTDCFIPNTNTFDSCSVTPLTNRRRFASKIEKAVQNFKPNFHLINPLSTIGFSSHNNNNNNNNSHTPPSSSSTAHDNHNHNNLNAFNASNSASSYLTVTTKQAKSFNASKFNTISSVSHSSYSRNTNTLQKGDNKNQLSLYSSNASNYDNNSNLSHTQESDLPDLNDSFNSVKRGAPLYIICEKAQIRTFRSEACKETRYAFIPVDTYEVRETKALFRKFCRACLPSTPVEYAETAVNNHHSHSQFGVLKQIQDSKWFEQLQQIINISNIIAERMDDSSSVMLCLEDGWDVTAQITSVTQLLQDPYYRTIEGFSVLIEREWLSMGHRFSRRNNHTIEDQTGFAPIFLQFLDVVHQLIGQFQSSFEFNEFYLEFLAYHYVSNRFKTFLLDSEFERVRGGLTPDLQSTSKYPTTYYYNSNGINSNTLTSTNQTTINPLQGVVTSTVGAASSSSSSAKNITCIWEYIQKVHYNSPIFYNFYFINEQTYQQGLLRPSSDISKLKLWHYYTKESLSTGPIYDLDLLAQSNDECWYPLPIKNAIDYYEDLNAIIPSKFEIMVRELTQKLKLEHSQAISNSIGVAPSLLSWKHVWDYFSKQVSKNMLAANCSTPQPQLLKEQHNFERFVFSQTGQCSVCNITFKTAQSVGFKCKNCSLLCHEKCADLIKIGCFPNHNQHTLNVINNKLSNSSDFKSKLNLGPQNGGRFSISSATKVDLDIGSACKASMNQNMNDSNQKYSSRSTRSTNNDNENGEINWMSNNNEHQLYAGYLKKQGAMFKQWKERYFVLDNVKHQLRYYDSVNDSVLKGVIDLSDVESITQCGLPMGGGGSSHTYTHTQQSQSPFSQHNLFKMKSNEDKSCFELKTSKRSYYFCAKNPQDATKWKESIETCLDS